MWEFGGRRKGSSIRSRRRKATVVKVGGEKAVVVGEKGGEVGGGKAVVEVGREKEVKKG